MNPALLTLITLLAVVPAAAGAEWCFGSGHLLSAAAAVGLCLPVAAATLVLGGVVGRRWPQFFPLAVMLGSALRIAAAVIGVLTVGDVVVRAGAGRDQFARWVAGVYLVTLVAESALHVRGAGQRAGVP